MSRHLPESFESWLKQPVVDKKQCKIRSLEKDLLRVSFKLHNSESIVEYVRAVHDFNKYNAVYVSLTGKKYDPSVHANINMRGASHD